MKPLLKDKKIAILMTNGFEESEFTEPRKALEKAGAEIHVISPDGQPVKAWNTDNWGDTYDADKSLDEVHSEDYNGLLLPGGVMNPDNLRQNDKAIKFATDFFRQGKPIAAICHGPWLLVETGALEGRKVTSYASIKTDLVNAGAEWVDEEVVVDQGLVTSRNPNDIPAFTKKMIEEFCEGVHEGQTV